MIKKDKYRCAMCKGVFKLIENETWNSDSREEEYKKEFPGASMENRDVVCDDCWNIVKPSGPFQ